MVSHYSTDLQMQRCANKGSEEEDNKQVTCTVNAEFNKTQVPFTIEKIRNYFNHMQILILTNEILAAV